MDTEENKESLVTMPFLKRTIMQQDAINTKLIDMIELLIKNNFSLSDRINNNATNSIDIIELSRQIRNILSDRVTTLEDLK